MKLECIYLTLLWAITVFAQTPTNFNVTSSVPLEVIVQPSNISITPSMLVSQAGMTVFNARPDKC